ncbi:MAG: P1 family peptidase [Thermodesulfobacteriota bacterium]
MKRIGFSEIRGIKVGHAQNLEAGTGCSVILCEAGASAGVDVRGGAPGTRETDLLKPGNMVEEIYALVLAGGSAFGLDAAGGVMQFLEERGVGFDVRVARVPIVCAAVLFDLVVGDPLIRPDKEMGYAACVNADEKGRQFEGCIGAGTGASVGKILGMERAMKSGIGTFALQKDDLQIGALVAVNCLGDVIDPFTCNKLAGPLDESGQNLRDTEEILINMHPGSKDIFRGNTTIGAVVTNAALNKAQAEKMACMSHDGYARTMRPAHTMVDGDTIFALSTGEVEADLNVVGLLGARVMERAVVEAVKNARNMYGLKAAPDLK